VLFGVRLESGWWAGVPQESDARLALLISLDEVLELPQVDPVFDSVLKPGDVSLLDRVAVVHRIIGGSIEELLEIHEINARERPCRDERFSGIALEGSEDPTDCH
jgi:hypothetical protein